MAIETISPAALAARLSDGREIAVLDVRPEPAFLAGHPLPAVHAPLDRLLDLTPGFVPRRTTPLVLCDDGEGLAGQAADRLAAAGYEKILNLEGGVPAWRAAGGECTSQPCSLSPFTIVRTRGGSLLNPTNVMRSGIVARPSRISASTSEPRPASSTQCSRSSMPR